MRPPLISFLILILAACAHTGGARTHDMSTEGHEAAASREDATAAADASLYDPNATAAVTHCGGGKGGPACWTSIVNPTDSHLADAERHAKMAADHRAASQALRDAEATACLGISPEDRDMSPFEHTDDIASVEPLVVQRNGGKDGPAHRTVGATVTIRAVPGLTPEWLQRVIDCHLARSAALGHEVPEMPDCPLVPAGTEATVTSTGDGFAVAIRADAEEAGEEILARARRLLAPGS